MLSQHQEKQPAPESDPFIERRQGPGSYYDDDATGYEIYDPEQDDEEEAPGDSKRNSESDAASNQQSV